MRATRFFEFVPAIVESGAVGGEVRLPPAYVQPIASTDVAAILTDIVLAPPVNGIVEIGGPQAFTFEELPQKLMSAVKDARTVMAAANARYFGTELKGRELTPAAGARLAATRYDDWLPNNPPPR